jgi:hypothetical protein
MAILGHPQMNARRAHGFAPNGAGIAFEICRPFHPQTQGKEWYCRALGVEVRQLRRLADLPPLPAGIRQMATPDK